MMVELKRISTALGLLAALTSAAVAQGPAPRANQLTADAVAGTLRASRNLAGYRIEIQARDGVVTLTGELGSPAQKAEALARTQYVAGVRSVVDQLQVANDRSVRTVQYQPNPVQYQPNPALAYRPGHGGTGAMGGDVIYGGGTGAPTYSGPIAGGPDQRWRTDSRGTGRHGGCHTSLAAGLSQLCMAQLCSLSQFFRGRLPDGLPLASLAEHRAVLSLSGSSAGLASRDPPLGRRHLVARLQEALHPAVLHPLPVRTVRLLTLLDRRQRDDRFKSRLEATRFQPAYFVDFCRL